MCYLFFIASTIYLCRSFSLLTYNNILPVCASLQFYKLTTIPILRNLLYKQVPLRCGCIYATLMNAEGVPIEYDTRRDEISFGYNTEYIIVGNYEAIVRLCHDEWGAKPLLRSK
jgi:hypothetical protein